MTKPPFTGPSWTRRALVVLSSVCFTWALSIAVTGGFVWEAGGWRLASRDPVRPVLLAIVMAGACAALFRRSDLESDLAWLWRVLERIAWPGALLLAGAVLWAGVRWGSFAAGGSDSWGYVSQADLWLSGRLRVPEPLGRQMGWPGSMWAFVPLGYTLAKVPDAIVPTYPAGLPILMALFKLVAGPCGPFLVVPVLGAIAVWFTYVLGRDVAGRVAGLLCALLLASSPAFLHMLMWPMSDVPVTAFWAASLVLAMRPGTFSALGAGLAGSMAILTRPNLAPVAIVLWLSLAVRASATRRTTRRPFLPVAMFTFGIAPSIIGVALLQRYLYGSPLTSGYGDLGGLYLWSNAWDNLRHYGSWFVGTQTPIVALALGAPAALAGIEKGRRGAATVLLLGVPAVVLLSYLFYSVFEEWWYLRFLLPAFPAVFLLTCMSVLWLLGRLPAAARAPLVVLLFVPLIAHEGQVAVARGVLGLQDGERRYADVGCYLRTATPANAVFLAMQESGSVRYYAGRATLFYPALPRDWLDRAMVALREHGLRPYILLEDWEEPHFKARFAASNAFGKLDWQPSAEFSGPVPVRLYDPETRSAPARKPDAIPQGPPGVCRR
jgi:hypothetical protein